LIVDNDSEESGYCWSDPIRLTETDAGNFLSVYNDEPAIADLGSGELLVVCNRFGTSKDATDFKTRSLTMRGIRFETIASVKPIELTAANEYPAPGEELEFDVTVKNDGLKKADGIVVALLMLEKDQYDENKDYAEDFDPDKDDYALIAFSDFEDIKLNPSEITTVHIDDDNTLVIRYEDYALELAAPDKLAENGYVIVALALEYNGEDMNGYVFDNAPYKAFEDAVKVDPVYSVNAIADSNRHETGSLSSNDFTYSAVVNGDGNIPMRDSDRLVVGPANIDTAGEYMSSALFLDVPLSELEDVECETGTAKSYSATFKIPEDRFTYGFTTIYTQIVDKDGRPLSSTQYINIESDAPYYVSVKDKDSDTELDSVITLHEGESIAMSGSYEPSTHFRDGKVVYSVEDTTVATVDENGVLTAVSEGSTILYASVDIYDAVREYSVMVSPVSEYILGDTDGDGNVTIVDATLIQRYDAQMITLSKSALKRSDVDRDDDVNIIDVTFIQRWLVDLPSKKEIGTVISE
ncbi:dockerin type I domain-containing protein, partial [Ruminococcus sp.]|uniref:dockerin type I domain-containing protein n=1 Tax=Ruminococcus sp. TaxID=41978 RepID=UPI00386D7A9C